MNHNSRRLESLIKYKNMLVNNITNLKVTNSDKTKIVKEIHPKRGRVLIFDGLTYHASSSPVHHPSRIVINYNFDGTTFR